MATRFKPNAKLRELRLARGLTLRDVEDRTGIDHSYISAIENGRRDINLRQARVLSEFFGVSIDSLSNIPLVKLQLSTEDFLKKLEDLFNEYEFFDDSSALHKRIFITKRIFDLDEAYLDDVLKYVKYISALDDFKEDLK